MEAPSAIIYYLLVIKPRNFKTLVKATLCSPCSLYSKKISVDFLHRLNLHAILAGEYGSDIYSIDHISGILPSVDECFFQPNDIYMSLPSGSPAIVNYFTPSKCRYLLQLREKFIDELEPAFQMFELPEDEVPGIRQEFIEAFDFLLEICSLIKNSKYGLIIISTPKEIGFTRFIPAPSPPQDHEID